MRALEAVRPAIGTIRVQKLQRFFTLLGFAIDGAYSEIRKFDVTSGRRGRRPRRRIEQ